MTPRRGTAGVRTAVTLAAGASALAVVPALAGAPLLAPLAAAAVALAAAALRRPDFATASVIFLLASNLPAVGVAFHGVPKPVAAAFPLLLLVPLARDFARGAPLVLTPASALLALLLALQLAGSAFARDPALALATTADFALEGVLLHLLLVNVVRSWASLRLALGALAAAGVLMAALPLFQQATGRFDDDFGGLAQVDGAGFGAGATGGADPGRPEQPRLAGTIGEKNRYAQVMLVLVPLAGVRCVFARTAGARFAAAACTAAIALGFALAFSRGGAVGAACLLAAMAALRLVDLRKAALVAAAAALLLVALPQYRARLATISTSIELLDEETARTAADGAVRRRLTSMVAAVRAFVDHPLVGVGPGMFLVHSQEYGEDGALRRLDGGRRAHSLPLEIAAEHGAIGLGLFIAVIATIARGLVAARRACSAAAPQPAAACAACLLALVAYLATGLFLHLSYLRYFALLLGLCSAATLVARDAARAAAAAAPAAEGRS